MKDFLPDCPLGKAVAYRSRYAPDLLFPIDRQPKRVEIGLGPTLPFVGEDLWNAYELSWLDARGKPVVALGTFRFPCDSPRLVESKSLKLYLNTFNQESFRETVTVRERIAADLSAACGAPVIVDIQPLNDRPIRRFAYPSGTLLDELDVEISNYHYDPALLHCDAGTETTETLHSHLLKSNCLVTGQPDWATVIVKYTGTPVSHEALLRYIVSFRCHNEFHEQCVERIFCDILSRCHPRRLAVTARYTRRGGLDINPFRSSAASPFPQNVFEVRQ